MGIAMMGVMHLYFKFTQPLFVQTIMTLKALYEAKPIWIHILGKPAEGDLERPFRSPGMFGGMLDVFCLPSHVVYHLFGLLCQCRPFPICLSTLPSFTFSPPSTETDPILLPFWLIISI